MKLKLTYLLLLPILSIIGQNNLIGSEYSVKSLDFAHYNTENGLSQSIVSDIIQDRYGFIWLATFNGLNRYDGYEFAQFRNTGKASELNSSYIVAIKECSRGLIWVSTQQGLGIFDYETGIIKNSRAVLKGHEINGLISTIAEVSPGNLWGRDANGIFHINLGAGTAESITDKEGNANIECDYIAAGIDGQLYFCKGMSLYRLCTESRILEKCADLSSYGMPTEAEPFGIVQLQADTGGDIWIGTFLGLVFVYSHKLGTVTQINVPKNQLVNRFTEYNDSTMLAALDGAGLFILSKYGAKPAKIIDINSFKPSIKGNKIRSMLIDKQGNLWVGHYMSGFSRAQLENKGFETMRYNPDKASSIPYPIVTSIWTEDGSTIWLGTDGGGLHSYCRKNTSIKSYTKESGEVPDNAILALNKGKGNKLWLGSYRGSLGYFDTDKFTFTQVAVKNEAAGGLPGRDIRSFAEDSAGNIWLLTHGMGITKYNPQSKLFDNYSVSRGISSDWTSSLLIDSAGNVWTATAMGLSKLKPSGSFTNYYNEDSVATSLPHNFVTTVFADSKKKLWVGTWLGICRYDYQSGTFTDFGRNMEMPEVAICAIEEDKDGLLWASTADGLYKIDTRQKKSKKYTYEDGLQGNEFIVNSKYKDKNGIIYFGGTNGISFFDPAVLPVNQMPASTYITRVEINGQPILGCAGKIEGKRLKHNQNFIAISFVGLNYINTFKNSYRHILEGLESNWTESRDARRAQYTSLPPGKYRFMVRSSNNDGVWDEKGASFSFEIMPPWWQTWWFRLTFILFVISCFIAFYAYKMKSVKEHNFILEGLVGERTKELILLNNDLEVKNREIEAQRNILIEHKEEMLQVNEELRTAVDQLAQHEDALIKQNEQLAELVNTKDKMLSIIAHDLKNPMNALIGFSSMMIGKISTMNIEKVEKFISIMNTSANSAYQLLENLLTWARSQIGAISIVKEDINIRELISEITTLIGNSAEKKGVQLDSFIDLSCPEHICADRNTLTTIIRNLSSNAVKYTPQGGKIIIGASREKDNLCRLYVQDSGIGMTDSQIAKLFKIEKNNSTPGTENESGTGLGLIICYEFAKMNGGKISVSSVQGKGSCFSITIPYL
jgi:signal transduction histidine kinase/ligand-binding sensor domain-containing protein